MTPLLALLVIGCTYDYCDSHFDCASDEICNVDHCERALDRDYRVVIDGASVGPAHPDGLDWDGDGSPPDLLAEVGLADGDGCVTTTDWDDYSPRWDQWCDLYFPGHDPVFLINLWDQDGDVDEFAAGFYWEGRADVIDLTRKSYRDLRVWDDTETVSVGFWLAPH